MTFTVNTELLPGLAEIVSSLPLSLIATEAAGQVVGLAGGPGWPTRVGAAVSDGALAVVVQTPSAADLAALDLGARAHVVLAWDFAANPGVHAAAAEAEPLRTGAGFAQGNLSVTSGTGLQVALLDLVVAATRVFGETSELVVRHSDDVGLHLTGHLAGGAPLTLSVVVTDAHPTELHLRLMTAEGGLEALVPSPATAAPAEVRVVDAQGEHLLPTIWVTSRRASWQDAVAVASGAMSDDVAELQRVVALLPHIGDR